jgi:copper oxidase (laccase) domain-containing protein
VVAARPCGLEGRAGRRGPFGGRRHGGPGRPRAARTVAVVGPCIAQASYEVGADFEERFVHHDPGAERFFEVGLAPDKRRFDLPGFVLWRLEQAGVGEAAWTGDDTCVDEARFFSNRRAFQRGQPDFGRLMSAIRL